MLWVSWVKIIVFLIFVFLFVIIIGVLMYFIEGGSNEGFFSIFWGVYWFVVIFIIVGYGDIIFCMELG